MDTKDKHKPVDGLSDSTGSDMHFLIAMDSFKGCLSSRDAGEAAACGIRQAQPDAVIEVCPIADGGEGTVEALTELPGARRMTCRVDGPYGDSVEATYLILHDGTAVVEMAQAAGLTLSPRREPQLASTYGVGMIIRDAIAQGCRSFIVGLGGSATNDGGAGMLQALGFGLLDAWGNSIARGAAGLRSLATIADEGVVPELRECRFRAACDVTSPLLGPDGCSAVFGPQKGATTHTVHEMNKSLSLYADIVKRYYPDADPTRPGAGAAGGLGFALQVFCHAISMPGLPLIAHYIHLEDRIRNADVVITGEGRMDAQTTKGKVAARIAALSKIHGKNVIALVGAIEESVAAHGISNIDAIFPVLRKPCSLTEAMQPENARSNIAFTAEQMARWMRCLYPGVTPCGLTPGCTLCTLSGC